MTYQEYSVHMKVCDFMRKEPTGHFRKIHDFLTGIWNDMEIEVNSQTNRIVFQKGGIWFFEQGQKNGYLWCNYDPVWSFFEKDMGITDTEGFIKSAVEEHLKCEVGTPKGSVLYNMYQVEEHLKCEVGTPVMDECDPAI